MANDASKLKLGVFLILVAAVLTMVVLSFGAGRIFRKAIRLCTYFDESVQGLEEGSAVKYRGVMAGRVSRVTLAPDGHRVRVDMEIDPDQFDLDQDIQPGDNAHWDLLRANVADGLRAQLSLLGITGMKYVELDFVKPPVPAIPLPSVLVGERVIFVPSKSSSLRQLEESVTQTVSSLAKVDFVGIAGELQGLLKNTNRALGDPRIGKTLENLSQTTTSLHSVVARLEAILNEEFAGKVDRVAENVRLLSVELREAVKHVDEILRGKEIKRAITDISGASASLRETTELIAKDAQRWKVGETMSEFRGTLRDTSEAAMTVSGLRGDLKRGLNDLELALESLRRLVGSAEEMLSGSSKGQRGQTQPN